MTVYVLREVWAYEYDVVLGVYSSMEALEAAREEYLAHAVQAECLEYHVSEYQVDAPAQFGSERIKCSHIAPISLPTCLRISKRVGLHV